MGMSEQVQNLSEDQIEYPNEEPWIRQMFEEELAKRDIPCGMPDGAYRDVNYQWDYTGVADH